MLLLDPAIHRFYYLSRNSQCNQTSRLPQFFFSFHLPQAPLFNLASFISLGIALPFLKAIAPSCFFKRIASQLSLQSLNFYRAASFILSKLARRLFRLFNQDMA